MRVDENALASWLVDFVHFTQASTGMRRIVQMLLQLVILHNILHHGNAPFYMPRGDAGYNLLEGQWCQEPGFADVAPLRTRAINQRLMEYFNSPVGSLAWQERSAGMTPENDPWTAPHTTPASESQNNLQTQPQTTLDIDPWISPDTIPASTHQLNLRSTRE